MPCDECEKIFTIKDDIEHKIRVCRKGKASKDFKCNICDESYHNLTNLQEHN